MKKKRFNKKLTFKKNTIASLQTSKMKDVKGGVSDSNDCTTFDYITMGAGCDFPTIGDDEWYCIGGTGRD